MAKPLDPDLVEAIRVTIDAISHLRWWISDHISGVDRSALVDVDEKLNQAETLLQKAFAKHYLEPDCPEKDA